MVFFEGVKKIFKNKEVNIIYKYYYTDVKSEQHCNQRSRN